MRKALAFGIVLVFVAMAPLLWVENSQGAEYAQGKSIFDTKCAICHGRNGKGDGPAAASLSPKPADFAKASFWQRKDIDQFISKTVLNGHGPMPAFQLSKPKLKALIDYMSHTFKPKE